MANGYVNIISWNINGCGNQEEETIVTYLKSKQADVVFIQESHLTDTEALKFRVDWVAEVYHSSFNSKQNGVIIMINKIVHFVILKQHSDKFGRLSALRLL
jgi:exonuclease III